MNIVRVRHSEDLECAVAGHHAACRIAACAKIAGIGASDQGMSLVVSDITLVALFGMWLPQLRTKAPGQSVGWPPFPRSCTILQSSAWGAGQPE
jgi:hypothetical protein